MTRPRFKFSVTQREFSDSDDEESFSEIAKL